MFDVYGYSPYPNVTDHVTISWAALVSNLIQMMNLSQECDDPTLIVDLSRIALVRIENRLTNLELTLD